jgi:hypothetical protein
MRLISSGNPALFKSDGTSGFESEKQDKPTDAQSVKKNPSVKKSRRRAIIRNMRLKTEGVVPPGLKLPRNETQPVYVKPAGERQVVNVVSMLINEQLGAALERFNICACGICCLEITQKALRELPPVFVHVSTVADADEVNEKIARFRPEVIKTLTKIALAARNSPYHKAHERTRQEDE